MRLCRFLLEDMVLSGFYADELVVPIDQAAEAYAEAIGEELDLPVSDDLLAFLPPDGPGFEAAGTLAAWVEGLDQASRAELAVATDEVRLLVPVPRPGKLLMIAGNYARHVEERGGLAAKRAETFPYVFLKPPSTTLTHPGSPIVIPRDSPDHIDWECELGVVIGRRCRQVSEADAPGHVAGYTVVNDVSDRAFTPNPGRKARERDRFFDWLHGKWHDTFCPMGPCLLAARGVDPQALRLTLTVNGQVKQNDTTAGMIFPVAAVVAFVSEFVTLEPGDVISTGTPAGVGTTSGTYLRPGDVVEATIEGIGALRNPVRAEEP